MKKMESKQKLDVVLVVTAAATARAFVSGYASHLTEKGYNVTIIADGVHNYSSDKSPVRWLSVPMRRSPNPVNDVISWFRLLKSLKRIRPVAVIYATPKASLLTALAAAFLRVPVRIYELWGLRLETTSGVLRWTLKMVERVTSYFSTSIIANSHSLAKLYDDLDLAAGHTIEVLGEGSSHGVDVDRFSPYSDMPNLDTATSKWLGETSGLLLGYVGRLNPDKGVEFLLQAAELSCSKGTPVRLLLVGGQDGAEIGEKAESVASVVPLHFAGSRPDPRPYFSVMDALVLPSRREGYPNVVLEASAMGIPSIVSDATGVIDSVVDGETGLIVAVADSEALANAIEIIAGQPKLIKELGVGARARVEENFIQREVWEKHSQYLAEQVSKHKGPKSDQVVT